MKRKFAKPRFYSPLNVPQSQFVGLRDRNGRLIKGRDDPEYMIAYMKASNEQESVMTLKIGSQIDFRKMSPAEVIALWRELGGSVAAVRESVKDQCNNPRLYAQLLSQAEKQSHSENDEREAYMELFSRIDWEGFDFALLECDWPKIKDAKLRSLTRTAQDAMKKLQAYVEKKREEHDPLDPIPF